MIPRPCIGVRVLHNSRAVTTRSAVRHQTVPSILRGEATTTPLLSDPPQAVRHFCPYIASSRTCGARSYNTDKSVTAQEAARSYLTSSAFLPAKSRLRVANVAPTRRGAHQGLLRASWNPLWPAIALAAVSLIYLGQSFWQGNNTTEEVFDNTTDDMSTATEMPPGRPGNLTPEQDELLRKLWARIFELCAVSEPAPEGVTSESATPEPVAAATAAAEPESEKGKKKSRLGFLSRRGKKDDKADKGDVSEASSVSGSGAATPLKEGDPEDKYGQNKVFLETLASQSPETIRATIWDMVKADHPDALVLRFLRARKWDVERALVMLVSSMNWRHNVIKVDSDIMIKGEEGHLAASASGEGHEKKIGEGFMHQLRIGKSFIHGSDRVGRPVCTVRVRTHRASEQVSESLDKYTVYVIETCRMMLNQHVDTATIVFDMTGFSMANMDYTPVKYMIQCFEANFPESLGVVLVHKAPWIFQGIWKIIRGWLDPVVAAKVHFTNNITELNEYISADKVPTELEGEEDWSYKYDEPVAGENAKMKDTATRDALLKERELLYREYEVATLRLLREAANSNSNSEEVRRQRDDIAARLRTQYWTLDPYIRARSWYDRIGVLNPGGVVNFYPGGIGKGTGTGTTTADDAEKNGTVTEGVKVSLSEGDEDGARPPLSDVTNTPAATAATNEKAGGVPNGNAAEAVPVNGVA